MLPPLTIDFETRSKVDLRKHGLHVYATDPSTQVLCLAYKIGNSQTKLWHRAHPHLEQSPTPHDLLEALSEDRLLEAHNAGFERAIWKYVLLREFDFFPIIKDSRWRCSAAKGAVLALPRSLANLGTALKLSTLKDEEGRRVMLKMCRARTPNKAEKAIMKEESAAYNRWLDDITSYDKAPGFTIDPDEPLWYEDPGDIEILHKYCIQDVDVEYAASQSIDDLSPRELKLFQLDMRMNLRGILCDTALAESAVNLAEQCVDEMNAELSELTNGEVSKGSARSQLKLWLSKDGLDLPNTQGSTVDEFLEKDDLLIDHKRILEICRAVNRTSTAKFKKLLDLVGDDGRLRDTQLYHGASTGRWSGKGFQPHNLVRGFTKDMEEVCQDLLGITDPDLIRMFWGDPMEVLSKATRGCLISSPGYVLSVADYAAIEARGLLWLAGDETALDVFRSGEDIYKDMASSIYKVPIENIDGGKRFMGKQSILGLGYGMGAEKFDDTCYGYGVTAPRKFFEKVVKIYREEKYPLVASLWADTITAALDAVKTGKTIHCRKTEWFVKGRFLYCRLPSGRTLAYCDPSIETMRTWHWPAMNIKTKKLGKVMVQLPLKYDFSSALNDAKRAAKNQDKKLLKSGAFEPVWFDQETLMVHSEVKNKWTKHNVYGGLLVENITQGVARDIMADAMISIDSHKHFQLLMTVHDEIVSERPESKSSLEEYISLLETVPSWAKGFPIKAEGWEGKRYRK